MHGNVREHSTHALDGAVAEPAQDTPYGRIIVVTGPMGAPFRIFMTAITKTKESTAARFEASH